MSERRKITQSEFRADPTKWVRKARKEPIEIVRDDDHTQVSGVISSPPVGEDDPLYSRRDMKDWPPGFDGFVVFTAKEWEVINLIITHLTVVEDVKALAVRMGVREELSAVAMKLSNYYTGR